MVKYWFWTPQGARTYFIFKEDEGVMTLYACAYVGWTQPSQLVFSINDRGYLQDWVKEEQIRDQGHSIPATDLELYAFEQGFVLKNDVNPYSDSA